MDVTQIDRSRISWYMPRQVFRYRYSTKMAPLQYTEDLNVLFFLVQWLSLDENPKGNNSAVNKSEFGDNLLFSVIKIENVRRILFLYISVEEWAMCFE